MIHSLSGGVIADNEEFLFAKVEVAGEPHWYLSPFSIIKAGDGVLVPLGKGEKLVRGVVLRTERCTRQTAPFPMNRIREIAEILPSS